MGKYPGEKLEVGTVARGHCSHLPPTHQLCVLGCTPSHLSLVSPISAVALGRNACLTGPSEGGRSERQENPGAQPRLALWGPTSTS